MEIIIPFKTPTINHLYGKNGIRTYMKPEAKLLREDIKDLINPFYAENLRDKKLTVHVQIVENWLTLKGDVRRKDIANREKFLIDSIFEGLGIDDKFIYKQTMEKIQDEEAEEAIVIVEEYHND